MPRFPDLPAVRRLRPYAGLMIPVALYLLLLLPTLGRNGIGWDEHMDWFIARSLIEDWLTGSNADPTQMRLPMYLGALVFALADSTEMVLARMLSAGLGVVAIAGTWIYARRFWSDRVANISAFILACSPYFLSYARLAFTESDMLLVAILPWMLFFGSSLLREPRVGWAIATAFALGLMTAAKFTAIVVIPAIIAAVVLQRLLQRKEQPLAFALPVPAIATLAAGCGFLGVIAWAFLPSLNVALAATESLAVGTFREAASHYAALPRGTRLLHYGLAAVLSAIPMLTGIFYRRAATTVTSEVVILAVLSPMVFLTVAPCHFANPLLLVEVVARSVDAAPMELAQLQENWATYILSVVLKSSPLVGIGLLAGLGHRFFLRESLGLQSLALITLVSLWIAVAKIDFSQIFYLLPTLPLLVIFGADSFMRVAARWPKGALAAGIAIIALLGRDLALSAPDYNLNGYQYLGNRYIFGRSSLGYVSVATLPNDGASQVMDWAVDNIPMDAKTLAFVPAHQIWAYQEARNWSLPITGGPPPDGRTDFSDYVYVLTYSFLDIEAGLGTQPVSGDIYKYPHYDRAELERDFEKVFSVPRRFGIEAGSVWKRKE